MTVKKDTRTKILATASKLFQIQGYHGTGLQQIIKESGCPKGSLYYYFPEGKEQLAAEAIARIEVLTREQLERLFTKHADVVDVLNDFFALAHDFEPSLVQDEGFPLALIALETSNMSERIRLACKGAYETFIKLFIDKFVECKWPREEAEEIVYMMITMIEGSSIFAFTNQSIEPVKRTTNIIMRIIKSKREEIFK